MNLKKLAARSILALFCVCIVTAVIASGQAVEILLFIAGIAVFIAAACVLSWALDNA